MLYMPTDNNEPFFFYKVRHENFKDINEIIEGQIVSIDGFDGEVYFRKSKSTDGAHNIMGLMHKTSKNGYADMSQTWSWLSGEPRNHCIFSRGVFVTDQYKKDENYIVGEKLTVGDDGQITPFVSSDFVSIGVVLPQKKDDFLTFKYSIQDEK